MSLTERMTARLSLRVRIFLFFLLAALASVLAVFLADYFAYQAAGTEDRAYILRAGVASAFAVFAVIVAVWLQFDTHVARPVERMSRYAHAVAHGSGLSEAALPEARYLGYLAPAVADLSAALEATRRRRDEAVREATARAERQKARLESVLHDLRDGILICNRDHEILLYNSAAVDILGAIGPVGLRRSVFDILSPEPVRHHFARLEKRVREGRHLQHGDGLSLPFAALCVDGRTTLEAVMTATLVPGTGEPQGYILFFSDETEMLAASAEAERQLISLAETIRERAGSLHLLGDLLVRSPDLTAQARELAASIIDEVGHLAAAGSRLDNLAMDHLSRAWPMVPVLARTLFDLVDERVRLPRGPAAEAAPDLAILCDSAAVAALLARLCEWVAGRGGTDLRLRAAIDNAAGFLDVEWRGKPISLPDIGAWLADALDHDLGPVTAADVLARHATDIWSESVPGDPDRARLRLPLEMRDMTALPAVRLRVPERAAVYDFEIFDEELPADLADTPLDRLTVVVFDTETTGLEPSRGDRIVSIAGIRIVNGRVIENEIFDHYVNPGIPIPPGSTAVHGITDAVVADAEPAERVVDRFAGFARDAVLVAHNAPFDMKFLALAAEPAGLRFQNPVLDTVLLAAHLHGSDETLTLDRLAEIYGVHLPSEARHTALGDSLATARVFLAMLGPLSAAGIRTLADAVRASERQAALRRKQGRY